MRSNFIATGLLAACLSACSQPEPRGQQYFEAHVDEARQVVKGCADGTVRGEECRNAEMAISAIEGRERTKRFLGDGKAYTPR